MAVLVVPIFSSLLLVQAPEQLDQASKHIQASPKLPYLERHLALRAPVPGWEIGPVSGVAVGRDGKVYVMQRGQNADPILVFDNNGSLLRSWGKHDFTLPHSLRLDAAGNVWAIDSGAGSKVIKYSPFGEKLLSIAVTPVPDTGTPFRGVTDIAFAPGGNLYITDGYGNARIIEYTASGSKVREWGRAGHGPAEFMLPHAIQIGPSGTVYVADRENGRIQKFTERGEFLRAINGLAKCYSLVLDGGVLWASMSPLTASPGAPGWIVELDPETGRVLGHIDVPDQRQGHELARLDSGELLVTAGSGLVLFSPINLHTDRKRVTSSAALR